MIAQSPNKLLASLPAQEYRCILPQLRTEYLRDGDLLTQCGETRVYFPGTCLCSVGNVMQDGRVIEIALVGPEGGVGMGALAGVYSPFGPRNSYVQVSDGSVQFILIEALSREILRNAVFRERLDAYSRGFLQSIIQSAACNRLHSLQERCARWLLSARDGLGRDEFEFTASFLASALGAKRSKLAVILRRLERLNLLEFGDGSVSIRNRAGLEQVTCGCYRRIKEQLDDSRPPEDPAVSDLRRRGNVVQLVPDAVCTRCHSAAGLPHQSEHECIKAIDAELDVLLARSQKLHKQRMQLLDQRMKEMREFLRKARSS